MDAESVPLRRRRLDHIDAMRPVKQLGVLSTHSLLFFAPASAFVGAALMLLHVSREGFLFVSACMLTYSYAQLTRHDLLAFWRRRLLLVGLPYFCWTLIYFFIGLHGYAGSPGAAALHLGWLVLTGYSQLYFLVVLLEFYALFPVVLWLLRRTDGRHIWLLGASLALQLGYTAAMHWNALPRFLTGSTGTRLVISYQLYLLAGALTALHYQAVHNWIVSHGQLIIQSTLVTAAAAEAWYWLALRPGFGFLGSASDAFQPIVIPFNLSAIALIYLAGYTLVRPGRSKAIRRLTHIGSDNSYAVYLSQVVFLELLSALGWKHLNRVIPWPFAVAGAVLVVFVAGCLLGGIFARTPLSMMIAGRHQVSGPSLISWHRSRRAAAASGLDTGHGGPTEVQGTPIVLAAGENRDLERPAAALLAETSPSPR